MRTCGKSAQLKKINRYSRLEIYSSHLFTSVLKFHHYRRLIKDAQFSVAILFLAHPFVNIRLVNYFR